MAPEVTVTCARCGASITFGSRFCPTCGAPQLDQAREERRVVTVLFGDIAGFTELSERRDAEEIKAIVDRTFERLAEIIHSFGGRVDKVIGDEIMAVFGAPQAHEDDAERAVRAALAIQRMLAEDSEGLEQKRGIALQMHIGVNTGEVVAGFVGGSDSYTVLGDAVNTARRIEEAAEPGQTLVGETTYEASRAAIEYRRIGRVNAKGKRLPVSVWEATSERGLPGARTSRAAPLIGREEELAVLDSLARIVRRDRRPLLATLVADAGMGKSRIGGEFARRASGRGMRVLNGRSLPYGTASAAFAVEEVMRGALGLDARGSADRAQLRERLDEVGATVDVEVLAPLLGLGGQARVRDAGSPASGTTPVMFEAAANVLERVACAGEGLVILFHELHWAEDPVLDFVQRLAQTRAPMLVISLARPELLERRPAWGSGTGSMVMPLEPLARDRAAEMLDALAPTLPLMLRESVLDRAGGNPFYVEELARLLLDRPAEERSTVTVPVSVQALVAARLDALPAAGKRLIQDAAVVGEQFWTSALQALGNDAAEALGSHEVRELIEQSEAPFLPLEPGFRFRQTLVREVAYASVPKHVRARQHAAVGEWLEQAAGDVARREVSDLTAHHFERAASLAREVGIAEPAAESKARLYLERAGDRALALDAAQQATRFFKRALEFSTDDTDRLGLRTRYIEALIGTWGGTHTGHAIADISQTLADARAVGDRAVEGKLLRLLGDAQRMGGTAELARESLAQALQIAKEIGDGREEAAGLRSHGQLELFGGRWSSSVLWFRQALARYRDLGDRRGEGWTLQNLGWASMLMGRHDDAIAYLDEGAAIFGELGDEEGAGWCLGMKAWVLLLRGDVMQAGAIAERLEHHLRIEHPEYLHSVGFALEIQRILRAYVEVLRGRFDEADRIAREAISGQDLRSAAWALALGHYPLVAVRMLRRDFAGARAAIEAGEAGARELGDPFYRGQFEFGRAWLAFEEGDLDAADDLVAALTKDTEAGAIWSRAACTRWLLASIQRSRGNLLGARAVLEERLGRQTIGLFSGARSRALLSEILTEMDEPKQAVEEARTAAEEAGDEVLARVDALRALGRALLAGGDPGGAEAAFREELALLEATDWELERARALALLARALDAGRRHDEASEALDGARAVLAAQPAGVDVADLEALLLT